MIINSSGSGAPLNFKVLGGTAQPENPKENTIWVNTGVEITGWAFSSAEPPEPAQGMLWLVTDNRSSASFNALKKNAVTVCPVGCKQYVNGAWTAKDAVIWSGGSWVDWRVYFVNGGDVPAVTGGWSAYHNTSDATVSVSSADGVLALECNVGWNHCCTKKPFSFDGFNTLKAYVTERGNGWGNAYRIVVSETHQTEDIASNIAAKGLANVIIEGSGEVSLDVSGISGECYVIITSGYNTKTYIKLSEMYLTR